MAAIKKDETVSMFDSFKEFKETKNIDRTTLVSVLEESFRNVLAKIFGSDENFDVIVNPDKGDFEIYRNRVVVADGEVQDENKEIALKDARKIEPDYEVGEDVSEPVDFSKFGRRAILNLRQTLASKVLELEHDSLYNKYKDRVGQVISSEVYQVWKREVLLVDDENNELLLPKTEQIQSDNYHKGDTIRAVILRVDNTNNNPKIILVQEPFLLDDELRKKRQECSNYKYAKSWLALCLPVAYCLLDAAGTFADSLVLRTLNEDSANCAYELTFLAAAVICFIYVVIIKKDKLVFKAEAPKYAGALFETAGQFAYIYALADEAHVALSAPIISAYCVASVLWSRIFLKEKLSWKHYAMIALVVIGIVMIGVFDI